MQLIQPCELSQIRSDDPVNPVVGPLLILGSAVGVPVANE